MRSTDVAIPRLVSLFTALSLALAMFMITPFRTALAQPATPADPPPVEPPTPPAPPAKTEIDDARTRMETGQRLFADGKFTLAADEFSAAYDKHKYNAFLFNAAVAAERGSAYGRAIDLYDRFLKA